MNFFDFFRLKKPESNYNKIFLDCGFHLGEGLADFINMGIIDNQTKIYCFEANPECNIHHRVMKIKRKYNLNITSIEKAVWTTDGYVDFFQEDHTISKTGSPSDGFSKIDGWGSSVKDVQFKHGGYGKPIIIPCLNFSTFLKKLPKTKIICKMDIEGSEFNVLRHLIKENTISLIDEIYVEFHQRFIENESKETELDLINNIESLGVTINRWK